MCLSTLTQTITYLLTPINIKAFDPEFKNNIDDVFPCY